jgi:hypothetical protein
VFCNGSGIIGLDILHGPHVSEGGLVDSAIQPWPQETTSERS